MSRLTDKIKAFFQSAQKDSITATVHARPTAGTSDKSFAKLATAAVLVMAAGMGVVANVESSFHPGRNLAQLTSQNVSYPAAKAEYWQRKSVEMQATGNAEQFNFASHSVSNKNVQGEVSKSAPKAAPDVQIDPEFKDITNKLMDEVTDGISLAQEALDSKCEVTKFVQAKTGFHDATITCIGIDGKPKQADERSVAAIGDIVEIGKYEGVSVYYSMGHGNLMGHIDAADGRAPALFIEHDLIDNVKMFAIDETEGKAAVNFLVARELAYVKIFNGPKDSTLTNAEMETVADAMGVRALMDTGLSESESLAVVQVAYESVFATAKDNMQYSHPSAQESEGQIIKERFDNVANLIKQSFQANDHREKSPA